MNIILLLWSFVNFCCLSQSEVSTDNRKVITFLHTNWIPTCSLPLLLSFLSGPFLNALLTVCNFLSSHFLHNAIVTKVLTLGNKLLDGCYASLGNVSCNLSRFRWSDEVKGTISSPGAAKRCDTSCRTNVTLSNVSCNLFCHGVAREKSCTKNWPM